METAPGIKQNPQEQILGKIKKILENERFSLTPESMSTLENQVRANSRFVCVVGTRKEEGQSVERFLKIPLGQAREIDIPFNRQILFGKFLKEDGRIKTRNIVSANLDRKKGLPYAVMETFNKDEAKIGFISGAEDMELLTSREAQSCVDTMVQLHQIDPGSVPQNIRESLQKISGNVEDFSTSLLDVLNKKVHPEDTDGAEEDYHSVLGRRLNVLNFKAKVEELVKSIEKTIRNEGGGKEVLVHGDLAPNNLYVYDNGEVEFLDLEWSGICDNEAIAAVVDFGNLRARAWNNREFRDALDAAVLDKYVAKGKEEMGKAIIALGILRSHMSLAGYFENYPLEKQRKEEQARRRESTEGDIRKAWKILGLELGNK